MKRLNRLFLILPFCLLALTANGQSCDWQHVPGVSGHPPMFHLIMGDFVQVPASQMVAVDDPAALLTLLGDSSLPDSTYATQRANFFTAGLMSLSGRNYADAAHLFHAAGYGLTEDTDCGAQIYRITARYLATYPRAGEQPIFSGFNGGYYNYLSDSLFWGNKQDTAMYDQALSIAMGLVQWSGANDPVYLELLGDLLTRYRDRFRGNYFGSLVYMRAGLLPEGANKDAYLRKGLFALEAPYANEDRFNLYRYTQLRKALEEGMQTKMVTGAAYPAGRISFFTEQPEGELALLLDKAYEQHMNREIRKLKFKNEVEIGTVKRDTTFNMYALLVIGFIISAVIFFWVQMRRHSKKS